MARLIRKDTVIETKNPSDIVRLKADGFREDPKATSSVAKPAEPAKSK